MGPLWLGLLLLVAACHKQPEPPEVRALRLDIFRAQRRLSQIETKLKDNIDDIGLKNALNEEQELVKSRLARLQHLWKGQLPDQAPPVWDGTAEVEDKGFSEEQHKALKSAKKNVVHSH